MSHRLDRVRAALAEQRLDGLLVSDGFNRRYLSGFTGSAGMLAIAPAAARLATDFRYWEQAESQAAGFEVIHAPRDPGEWFRVLVAPFGGRRLGFEAEHVSVAQLGRWREYLEAAPSGQRPELVPVSGLVEALRAIKSPDELASLTQAVALGDAAFADVAARIRPGWSERQVAWEVERHIREHGGDGISFSTIVAGGAWGAMAHARPRDVPLRDGEGVVIDMGALAAGYCSDMTRTIYLGEPDPKFREIYDIVLTAQLAAEEIIETGMGEDTAHEIAHRVIREAGYGDAFGHGLGHGIGLQVHEAPWLRPTSSAPLREGMVFSIEPGIYIPGWGGVRIEDLVVLEDGHCRVLTRSPKLLAG